MPDYRLHVTVVRYPDRPNLMMRYTDPVTGQHKARSTGTNNRREAERAAAKWEDELRAGRYKAKCNITWEEFRERYDAEKGATLAANTENATSTAFNHLERIVNPKHLAALTTEVMSRFQARLREEGMKATTISTHLRHLRAAFSWAVTLGLLAGVPDIHMPPRARGQTLMRGRPITEAEFERMLAMAAEVRPRDSAVWQHYLQGLWLSGLRLEESTVLSWDHESPFAVDLSGRHPRFRVYAEAEKGRRDRLLPMTPDFAEYLLETPEDLRTGHVFKLCGLHIRRQMTSARVGRIVSDIGRRAGVLVNSADGKYATAHDLRRSFGTRWARRVLPATLRQLMRHSSIETTMRYYVDIDADDVADELWEAYRKGRSDKVVSRR